MKHRKGKKAAAPKKAAKRISALETRARRLQAKEQAFLLLEGAASERMAAIEARERAADAREAALTARDGLANERDRLAAARDASANERERRAAEREAAMDSRIAAIAGRPAAGVEETDEQALERAQLEAQLQRAHLDGLTGAYRREVGRLALRNEIERARRSDGRFVIAFIDVDGLKGVNDREGHAAGDRVLRTLAATMRANLRSYDPIVRYGGDEFLCGVAQIDAVEVQQRLGVVDQSLRHATGVGITAGLAAMHDNESLEELTERADAALLEAKRCRPNN
ncbi:MAG: GGDEF domain-containing protein [Candidatus Limnocylindrales bacterium]